MQEMQETWVQSLDQEDPLEEGMATHSSTLAWRITWTEEPGGLQYSFTKNQTRLSTHARHGYVCTNESAFYCIDSTLC